MPSDAKFGLIVGMVLVLLIALLFFRKEGVAQSPGAPAPQRTVPVPAPKLAPAPKIAPPMEADDLPPPAFDRAP